MRNFVGYAENENFKVGCTGQTTYVYDKDGNELARFKKDILYGYTPIFCPRSNTVVVKSTAGQIAVYNLDDLNLVKKFRVVKDATQDYGMCFSKDGKLFYNIETHISCRTRLTIYDTQNFEPIKKVFEDDEKQMLIHIECDEENENIYVLGYMRDDNGIFHQPFVAQFENDEIINKTNISRDEYKHLRFYKDLQADGTALYYKEEECLEQIGKLRLADYIK